MPDFAPELRCVIHDPKCGCRETEEAGEGDFKGRHFEAWLIIQAVSWYLRYPLSYRDLESMFEERGFEVDHSTLNRWVLAYAPLMEKRLRQLLAPGKIGTDASPVYPATISACAEAGLMPSNPTHRVSKYSQQGVESDHFRVKKNMPKIGGFQSFVTARRTIAGFEAMLWLKKGSGFSGEWTIRRQNELLAFCFGRQMVNNP